jgi:plasmid stability protein
MQRLAVMIAPALRSGTDMHDGEETMQTLPGSAIIDSMKNVTRGRQLVVRNIEEEVVLALKMTAARHGRSAEAEDREILRRALLPAKDHRSIKDLLLSMPDVGDDADFERVPDNGREVDL